MSEAHASTLEEAARPAAAWISWRQAGIVFLVAAEAALGALLYAALMRPGSAVEYLPAWLTLAGMFLATYAIGSLMQRWQVKIILRQRAVLALLVVFALLGGRLLLSAARLAELRLLVTRPGSPVEVVTSFILSELVMLAAVFLAWQRGLGLVSAGFTPALTLRTFKAGMLVFGLYGVLGPEYRGALPLALFIFLAACLTALSCARLWVNQQLRGGELAPFEYLRLGGFFISGLAVVGALELAAWVLRQECFGRVLAGVLTVALGLLGFLASPFVWLATRWMGRLEQAPPQITPTPTPYPGVVSEAPPLYPGLSLPALDGLEVSLRALLVVALVVVGALALRRYLRAVMSRARGQAGNAGQGVNPEGLFDGARQFFSGLLEQFRKGAGLRQFDRLLAAARIRRVYAAFLRACAELGAPRPAAVTPLEFLPAAGEALPGLAGELRTITDAYLKVRYGEIPESRAEVEQVEAAWRRIEAEKTRRLKAAGRRQAAGGA
jgi:hypothetical protein